MTVVALTLFVGMLFWAKLRVIHDIPRSAYAVPEDESAEKSQSDLQGDKASDHENNEADVTQPE
ncbi:MAG: hypothetical protein CMJ31_01815 [Phycisphaerae bacterium]|nr:hypothetical protein [Phycisphaerae bacterium]